MSRQVLILGAGGRFGLASAQAFAHAGWQVLAQVRRANTPLPPGVQRLAMPLADTAALAQAAAGTCLVVFAVNVPYPRWAKEALALAGQGMDLAQALNARFLLPGNVYNFGEQLPACLDETALPKPSTRKGRIRCAIEDQMRQRSQHGLHCAVLRAGDYFGGQGGWFDEVIVKDLARGKLAYPGPLDVPHAWAYLPDLARAAVALAELPEWPPFAEFHFAGHTLTGSQLLTSVQEAARSLGREPAGGFKITSTPWGLLRALGWLVPLLRELVEMAYLWRVPHALNGRKLAHAVGPLPSTPLAEALGLTLAGESKMAG